MITTFQQVLDTMLDLEGFLVHLGVEPGRLRTHINTIQIVEDARRQGYVDHIDSEQTRWSITEALEFAGIFSTLKDYNSTILARKFKETLQGPARPASENFNTNHGRNTGFELLMAARFRKTGVFRELLPNPDILCAANGNPIYVQCKRPLYEHGIKRNIARAHDQLVRDLAASNTPNAYGIIAISLSRILSKTPGLLAEVHTNEAVKETHRRIDDIAQQYGEICTQEPSIIGTVFHVMMPIFTKDDDRKDGRLGSVDVHVIYRQNHRSNQQFSILQEMFREPAA